MSSDSISLIEKLPEITKSVKDLIEIGLSPFALVFIAIMGLLINKIPLIFDYVKKSKNEKLETIQNAIDCNYISSDLTKKHLKNLYAQIMFKRATGLDCDAKLIDPVISLLNTSDGSFTIQTFIRIRDFIRYDNENIKVRLSNFEWYELLIMYMLFFILAISCSSLLSISLIDLFLNKLNISKDLYDYGYLCLALLILLFMYIPYAQKYLATMNLYKIRPDIFINSPPKKYTYILFSLIIIVLIFLLFRLLTSWVHGT